jgi:hypothetical protein
MKSWARLLIIFLAYGIALLHTAVPHHHSVAGNSNSTSFHSGCVGHASGGLLQRVLSTDLGYGHLETFKKNTGTDIRFSSRTVLASIVVPRVVTQPTILNTSPEFSSGYIEKLKKRLLFFSVTHLRAPPSFA